MSLKNIVKEIEQVNPEQVTDRRELFSSFGSKVALASLPFAIGSLVSGNKATAKTTAGNSIVDALNFVLSLSYVQYNFFRTGNNTGGLIPQNSLNNQPMANDLPGFESIEANERAHIVFLNTAITALGGTPYTPPFYNPTYTNPYYVPTAYDFTMGGTYTDVFSNYDTFLMIAQVMLDTTVRAMKSQILVVSGNTKIMTQLLQMNTAEARHAAYARTVRRYNPVGAPEHPAPWITNDISPIPALHTTYKGEDNLMQWGGQDITLLPDKYSEVGTVPKISATAAFDEPYDVVLAAAFYKKFMAA